jgi:predicted AlkP superfamily pyrophosphatase or phosphodiesterase
MRAGRWQIVGLFVLSLVGLGLALFSIRSIPVSKHQAVDKPRLAVLVVIDQFRGDYLKRWGELFEKDGFQRLMTEGAWFTNCHYPYANTVTGVGHATLATGCLPAAHGIIANDWYDRRDGEKVYCATLPRYEQVPPPLAAKKRNAMGGAPGRLLSPTIADALKKATDGQGRVVALSLKDRSSILPAGRRSDVCYWADRDGRFVTSTYYPDGPHAWVTAFNQSGAADRWRGKTWERLRSDIDYAKWSGPDDAPGEGKGVFQGKTFPHPFDGGPKKLKRDYYAALANSPFGNDLLLDLARRAIEEEKLGSRETPDLLSISFSSNDLVGHTWGPDSQEVLDTTLRTDLIIRDLLAMLDEKVGKGKYTLVLSADHGICPLPEASRAAGRNALRVDPRALRKGAEAYLDATFASATKTGKGTASWIEASVSDMFYLNHKLLASRHIKQSDAESAVARWLVQQPGIEAAYTRTDLLTGRSESDPIRDKVLNSFHKDRSGDVCIVLKPYCLPSAPLGTGTTHGSPHDYDTYVPLLVFGPGVKAGTRDDRVSPEAAAVVLAHALGIDPPSDARVGLPDHLFISLQ